MKNIKCRGVYDYTSATGLDNIAYDLYLKSKNIELSDVYYTQTGFVGSVGCEKFYKEAKFILRRKKIERIDIKRQRKITRSIQESC